MEKKYNVAIYLNAVLVCLALVCSIIKLTNDCYFLVVIIEVGFNLLICFYAFVGYKKPHGNLLRYLMFIFGLMLMSRLHVCSIYKDTKSMILFTVSIALISYMSGRLNKIEKNKYIAVAVLLMLIHCSHAGMVTYELITDETVNFVDRISMYAPAFMWIALSSAYFTRFLQHKEAGLTDK